MFFLLLLFFLFDSVHFTCKVPFYNKSHFKAHHTENKYNCSVCSIFRICSGQNGTTFMSICVFTVVSGADVVDWLYSRVEGFKDRRDARKYASSLLKHGYLRHTVNKITFSEQCYYTFGDLCQSTATTHNASVTQLLYLFFARVEWSR